MTKNDFLIQKCNESITAFKDEIRGFFANPSVDYVEPFEIADGLYYVGDRRVCIHLIDTGDGLILIDSGYTVTAAYILVDNIWRLGYDPRQVRWIIHTHGHFDHFGASEEFRRLYGAKLAISRVDAESLRKYPKRAIMQEDSFPLAKIPEFDYEIEDGEIFELGNTKIRCVLTPGHTAGVLSLFFNVTYNENEYLAGLFGGAGVGNVTLPYLCYCEESYDLPQQMLKSIEKLWNEPVTVHLGNHPLNNDTLAKREMQLKEGGNPFIAPESWQKFLAQTKERLENVIKENAELESKLSQLFGE